jgi:hypothetical protein
MYKTWVISVPGGPVADKNVRDGTTVMTKEAFEILCEQNNRDVIDNTRDNENDADGDVSEQDTLEGAELRMI